MEKEQNKVEEEKTEDASGKSSKVKEFLGKIGAGIVSGAKKVGNETVKLGEKVKSNIEEHVEAKELEKKLKNIFNSEAIRMTLVIPEKKEKLYEVYVRIDYNSKSITMYGNNNQINKDSYFVDIMHQKFKINLIRLNQSIQLELGSVLYKRDVTIIDYILQNDEATKQQMQTVINNQITIKDSTINKSSIG